MKIMDFSNITNRILSLTHTWEQILLELPTNTITEKRNKQNRTILQILGHLVDSASNNHQRMVRLQYNKVLVFPDYQQDNDLWIALQDYQHTGWYNLVQLWKYYNLHMVHLIQTIDQTKLENTWQNFENRTVTLRQMIEYYPAHMELHFAEIQELIDK
ncbi:MAG: DinB family protein [Bacteroidales bacterium]|nr:DinB family protein [Bacteroidales bacterium]